MPDTCFGIALSFSPTGKPTPQFAGTVQAADDRFAF